MGNERVADRLACSSRWLSRIGTRGRLIASKRPSMKRRKNRTRRHANSCVYFDYAATTPVAPQVVEAMSGCLGREGLFGNAASSPHRFGVEAKAAVEGARDQVAQLIAADPAEIVWTSGATESINLAVKGAARGARRRGRHVVTSSMEHKAVLDSCARLAREGFEVTFVDPGPDGTITRRSIENALRRDTILVSLMHVNNEVGTITDVAAVGRLTRERGIVFHVDASQSAARLPLDVREMRADLVSLSGHKMYGPKGVGALYARSSCRSRLEPEMHGGDQEQGLRSGTLATHQVVGMGKAAELARERLDKDAGATAALDLQLRTLLREIPRSILNGNQERRVPGILSAGFVCVDSEALLMALRDEVAISSGSACTSARVEPSHVLKALGLSEETLACSVRFSLGRYTTAEEVDFVGTRLREAVADLRQLSPGWTEVRAADRQPERGYRTRRWATA